MIRCNDVYKSFSGKTVLSGIDFDICDGEIFGLESCAVADRAFNEGHLLLKSFADIVGLAFLETSEEVRDDAFEGLAPFVEATVHIGVENDDFAS